MDDERTDRSVLNEETSSDSVAASRKPSKLWLVVLLCLAVGVVVAHGVGLHSLATFSSQQQQWEAEKAQRESVRHEWEQLAENRRQEAGGLNDQLQKLKGELDTFRAEHKQAKDELDQVSAGLAAVRRARDAAVAQQQEAGAKMASALDAEEKAKSEAAKLQIARDRLESGNKILEDDKRTLQQSVQASTATLDAQRQQLEQVRADIKTENGNLNSVMENLRNTRRDAQQEWDALKRAKEELMALQQSKTEVEDLVRKKGSLAADLDSLGRQVGDARKDLDLVNKQVLQAKNDLQQAETQTRAEQEKCQKAKQDLATAAGELAQLKKAVDDLNAQQTKLQAVIALLEPKAAQNEELSKAIAAKTQELQGLQKQVEAARDDLASITENLRKSLGERLEKDTSKPTKGEEAK